MAVDMRGASRRRNDEIDEGAKAGWRWHEWGRIRARLKGFFEGRLGQTWAGVGEEVGRACGRDREPEFMRGTRGGRERDR